MSKYTCSDCNKPLLNEVDFKLGTHPVCLARQRFRRTGQRFGTCNAVFQAVHKIRPWMAVEYRITSGEFEDVSKATNPAPQPQVEPAKAACPA